MSYVGKASIAGFTLGWTGKRRRYSGAVNLVYCVCLLSMNEGTYVNRTYGHQQEPTEIRKTTLPKSARAHFSRVCNLREMRVLEVELKTGWR